MNSLKLVLGHQWTIVQENWCKNSTCSIGQGSIYVNYRSNEIETNTISVRHRSGDIGSLCPEFISNSKKK